MNILAENSSIRVDCILASGIFAYQNQYFLEEFIQKSFNTTNHSLGFNCLSSLANGKEDRIFYANPFEILAFCQKITPWVTLRLDYDARDFTIYMYKERNI